jgi:type VII secretion-associated serine protease mycosin
MSLLVHVRIAAAAMLLGALGTVSLTPVDTAQAAASCGQTNQVQPGEVVAETPWAQRHFDLQRLDGIADGRGQLVAVLDSGVNATHPQLTGAVVKGSDGIDRGGNGQLDCVGHGTAVASIVAARSVAKVAFRGIASAATILPYRVSERQQKDGQSASTPATDGVLAQSLTQAVDAHATVINISMVDDDTPALRQAIEYAISRNVVVVAAAGNNHDKGDPTPYPAAYPGVIGVGAINPDGSRWQQSQAGTYVDLVAPGAQITAALPQRGHLATYEGTSFATPFVAGTAALIRQYRPELSAAEVAARLIATADPSPGGPGSKEYGAGIVNPYRAVTEQTGGAAQALPPLPSRQVSTADTERADRARSTALGTAGALLAATAVVACTAVILPAGRRRRWRPGLPPQAAGTACAVASPTDKLAGVARLVGPPASISGDAPRH